MAVGLEWVKKARKQNFAYPKETGRTKIVARSVGGIPAADFRIGSCRRTARRNLASLEE
jgi:hypothetical protein